MKDLKEVIVDRIPPCDLCKNGKWYRDAEVDGKTKMGQWAYMCEVCFNEYGVGLGTGKGQILKVNHE